MRIEFDLRNISAYRTFTHSHESERKREEKNIAKLQSDVFALLDELMMNATEKEKQRQRERERKNSDFFLFASKPHQTSNSIELLFSRNDNDYTNNFGILSCVKALMFFFFVQFFLLLLFLFSTLAIWNDFFYENWFVFFVGFLGTHILKMNTNTN